MYHDYIILISYFLEVAVVAFFFFSCFTKLREKIALVTLVNKTENASLSYFLANYN